MPSSAPDRRLPRARRLIRPAQFQAVYAKGRKAVEKRLIIWVLPVNSGEIRLGAVAGRRVGKAVARNRARRLLREAFRRHRPLFRGGADVVLVARRSLAEAAYRDVEEEVLRAARKTGLFARRDGSEAP